MQAKAEVQVQVQVQVQPMGRADLEAVMAVESVCFAEPLARSSFLAMLRPEQRERQRQRLRLHGDTAAGGCSEEGGEGGSGGLGDREGQGESEGGGGGDVAAGSEACDDTDEGDSFGSVQSCVALVGGRVVGYVALDTGSAAHGGQAWVVSLAVLPPFRGAGAARELMRRAMDDAARAGARRCWLHVHTANVPAQRLYRRLGFAVTEHVPGYYGCGRSRAAGVVGARSGEHDLQCGDALMMASFEFGGGA
jgi:ribosomal-protein-alanine N-acetyltransferase